MNIVWILCPSHVACADGEVMNGEEPLVEIVPITWQYEVHGIGTLVFRWVDDSIVSLVSVLWHTVNKRQLMGTGERTGEHTNSSYCDTRQGAPLATWNENQDGEKQAEDTRRYDIEVAPTHHEQSALIGGGSPWKKPRALYGVETYTVWRS